jgi:predicted RNase H-like HicB family nuclease
MVDTYQLTVVIEPEVEGGAPPGDHGEPGAYHAFVPALPGCHSFVSTVDEARANIPESIALHIECMREDGEPIPIAGEPLFVTRLSVPALS